MCVVFEKKVKRNVQTSEVHVALGTKHFHMHMRIGMGIDGGSCLMVRFRVIILRSMSNGIYT
jgi:methylaspartate ammonia-lyase